MTAPDRHLPNAPSPVLYSAFPVAGRDEVGIFPDEEGDSSNQPQQGRRVQKAERRAALAIGLAVAVIVFAVLTVVNPGSLSPTDRQPSGGPGAVIVMASGLLAAFIAFRVLQRRRR